MAAEIGRERGEVSPVGDLAGYLAVKSKNTNENVCENRARGFSGLAFPALAAAAAALAAQPVCGPEARATRLCAPKVSDN